jgi:hypothetical protein
MQRKPFSGLDLNELNRMRYAAGIMNKLFTATLISLIGLVVGANSAVVAQSRLWRSIQGKPVTQFDFNCAETSWHPRPQLNEIIQDALRREDTGVSRYGDRAFGFDLNGDGRTERFVPLTCGATGNCQWAVLQTDRPRLLGVISGQILYVYRLRSWPIIITYSHVSAIEGALSTYRYRNNKYLPSGEDYAINHGTSGLDVQGGRGHKMPPFLARARKACKDVGD